eukprot:361334-Chlamydomonas_euryale.AAC.6
MTRQDHRDLVAAYEAAVDEELYPRSIYMMCNEQEYWATGAKSGGSVPGRGGGRQKRKDHGNHGGQKEDPFGGEGAEESCEPNQTASDRKTMATRTVARGNTARTKILWGLRLARVHQGLL